jgi:stearoyl-CoA desaturase (Delta-9 desaturase)
MRLISRGFVPIMALGLVWPFALGLDLTGELTGGLTALLWGGLVRIFLNVFWLALPSLGECWHHNHHAFPRSARHGLRPWEIDLGGLVIGLMRRLGLAWNVVLIPPERQRQKLA